MTPADYRQWKSALGLSGAEACRRLGLSKNMDARYSRDGAKIPRYVALACAALARGIRPWPE